MFVPDPAVIVRERACHGHPKRFGFIASWVMGFALLAGCGGGGGVIGERPGSPPTPAVESYDAEIAFCATRTNELRATIGRPPLARSAALETYAAAAAKHDGTVQMPHDYFRQTGGGGAAAENEIPWWPLPMFANSVMNLVRAGVEGLWAEGPGGGHYRNMSGNYTQIGCGIYRSGDLVTVIQAFR